MKRPWFAFYAIDWLTDVNVMAMTLAERGAYLHLLSIQWLEGGIPNDEEKILQLLGVHDGHPFRDPGCFLFDVSNVLANFVTHPKGDGLLINRRLESVRDEADEISKKRAKAGKKGGKVRASNCLDFAEAKAKRDPKQNQAIHNHISQKQEDPDPEETASADGSRLSVKPKAKRPRQEKLPEPLPFTIAAGLEALHQASDGKVVVEPFDAALAKPITAVIRALPNLDDWCLAGQWIAAGGESWRSYDLRWLAKAGNLSAAVGHARAWAASGKGPVDARPSNGLKTTKHYTPAPPPSAYVSGDLTHKL